MSAATEAATVLLVDDEQAVADVYALRLQDQYETRTAYGGQEALDTIDADVDVVLLDRRMPDISGDDVLTEIRQQGYGCRVIMLTAVDPGVEILEMDFDDYLCKPIEKADLVTAIEQQLRVKRSEDSLGEYFEAVSKLSLLEAVLPPQKLESDDELEALRERVTRLRSEIDESVTDLEEIEAAFDTISRRPS